ncbi:hypothetical protein KIH79_10665 [Bifidobacterium sp. 82T10]|uniref:HTH cro/C1-type domain-containing protein n=1 Tax=Bifidobacterium miconis TaxID=2834435 RepID=A0ABS6WHL6_9BIFI|nr:hypothetical protein [Bifidobacterium miconis]MBW3093372.1 hypothetical protein [Bifidobacterium miconis]
MAKDFVFREGFIDRVRKMSGLKTEEALAGALGVEPAELHDAVSNGRPTPKILVGLFDAFGFTPGEVTIIEDRNHAKQQDLVA